MEKAIHFYAVPPFFPCREESEIIDWMVIRQGHKNREYHAVDSLAQWIVIVLTMESVINTVENGSRLVLLVLIILLTIRFAFLWSFRISTPSFFSFRNHFLTPTH